MKYENEIIILIEYFKFIPFNVITEYSIFDFALYNNEWLMFYGINVSKNWKKKNGKKIIEYKPNYCDPKLWQLWVDRKYTLVSKLQKGIQLLKKPLMLQKYHDKKSRHNNPFVIGDEVDYISYCERCNKHFNDDGCPIHGWKEIE